MPRRKELPVLADDCVPDVEPKYGTARGVILDHTTYIEREHGLLRLRAWTTEASETRDTAEMDKSGSSFSEYAEALVANAGFGAKHCQGLTSPQRYVNRSNEYIVVLRKVVDLRFGSQVAIEIDAESPTAPVLKSPPIAEIIEHIEVEYRELSAHFECRRISILRGRCRKQDR